MDQNQTSLKFSLRKRFDAVQLSAIRNHRGCLVQLMLVESKWGQSKLNMQNPNRTLLASGEMLG